MLSAVHFRFICEVSSTCHRYSVCTAILHRNVAFIKHDTVHSEAANNKSKVDFKTLLRGWLCKLRLPPASTAEADVCIDVIMALLSVLASDRSSKLHLLNHYKLAT